MGSRRAVRAEPASARMPADSFIAVAVVAGAIANVATDAVVYPLETIKTRLQSSAGFSASGGRHGLFRGFAPLVIGSAPAGALFFVGYEGRYVL